MDRINFATSDISRSLLNHYVENRNVVNEVSASHEIEMLKVLDLLDRTRQKWADETQRNSMLHEQAKSCERELEALRQEHLSLNEQLRHARAQIAALVSEREELKLECREMEKKFQLVKELLKPEICHLNDEEQMRLAFLNSMNISSKDTENASSTQGLKTSRSQDEEVDYDKTDDLLEHHLSMDTSGEDCRLRNGKVYRRSQMKTSHPVASKRGKSGTDHLHGLIEEKEIPAKRPKDSACVNTSTLITTTTTVTMDADGRVPPKAKVTVRRSLNRSFSESELFIAEKQEKCARAALGYNLLTPQCATSSVLDVRTPLVPSRSWIKGASIENRAHTFTNYTSIMGDKCDVCARWIGFGGKPACKCNDCNLHLHKSCIDRAPMPCVLHVPTPRTPGKQRPRLKDFCPNTQPMIPHLIIHCVIVLEKYFLNCEGLYRIPGQESQVIKLLNEFRNPRFQPKLRYQDPETITGCIKRFLKQLRDSLIPSSSWDEFVSAATQKSHEAIDRCINDLPIPNRDTLAFLCSHFQKVCDNCVRNKMTPEVLARSIAPTVVGRSPMRTMNFAQGSDEALKQAQVMRALLDMPRDYWLKFYSCEKVASTRALPTHTLAPSGKQRIVEEKASAVGCREAKISPSAADRSILGPIRTPPSGLVGRQHLYQRKKLCLTPY